MESLDLRKKLVEQFNSFIQDDSKLVVLDGIFDSMMTKNSHSVITEEQYNIVEKRHEDRIASKTQGKSWEEVKNVLKQKYGF